jgi:DNA recombination-dependent growth factor C
MGNRVTFVTYRVSQIPSEEEIFEGIVRGKIGKVDLALGKDRTCGFARFQNPLSTDFSKEDVFFQGFVFVSFRIDKYVVPASTLRLYVKERVESILKESGRQRLRKEEKEEIADEVRKSLLSKALPAINAYKVIWAVEKRVLRLFCTSRAVRDEFEAWMHEFLGVTLSPFNMATILRDSLGKGAMQKVLHLLPVNFGSGQ